MAEPGLPSPDTFSFIITLVEKFGILPMAGILWVLWKIGWIGNRKETPTESQPDTTWREHVNARLTRLETQQQDRWDLIQRCILPMVKQPLHAFMDNLLDKLHRGEPMSENELAQLEVELLMRLSEPEPTEYDERTKTMRVRYGYKLYCVEALTYVRECLGKYGGARGDA